MNINNIPMQQVVTRLRNRGYIGDHPRCALRLSGDDYDDAGRSRDFWLYVQEKGSTFPENYSLTTSRQGLTFSKKRPIPAGSLMLYACDYCRNSFGRPVSLDGWFCAAVYTPKEQEVRTLADLAWIMGLPERAPQLQELMKELGL